MAEVRITLALDGKEFQTVRTELQLIDEALRASLKPNSKLGASERAKARQRLKELQAVLEKLG